MAAAAAAGVLEPVQEGWPSSASPRKLPNILQDIAHLATGRVCVVRLPQRHACYKRNAGKSHTDTAPIAYIAAVVRG